MSGLVAIFWSYFYRYLLGLNWRLEPDSGRSFYRAKLLCYAIAYVYYKTLTVYYTIKRLVQGLPPQLSLSKLHHNGTFRYPPIHLSSSWWDIRLLKLHPGHSNAPLVGTLVSRPVITIWLYSFQFDIPAYDALSYCWGDESPSIPMLLSGDVLRVTPNLAAALTRLRLPDRPRYVWADYICINQNLIAEKNACVPHMGEIYANARTVAVWLGEHTESSRVLLSALEDVDDATAENSGMYFTSELQPGARIHESVLAALRKALKTPAGRELCLDYLETTVADVDIPGLESLGRRRMAEMYLDLRGEAEFERTIFVRMFERILASAWFGRMWTVQEPALARELNIYVGDSPAVPWRRFVGALRIVTIFMPHDEMMLPSVGNQALEVVELLRHTWYSLDGPKYNIREVLEACRPRKAGNVRDKVYGLLGLYGSWSVPRMPAGVLDVEERSLGEVSTDSIYYKQHRDGKGPSLPLVDYNKSEEQVFTETALACMDTGSLRILKDCCALMKIPPVGTEISSSYHGQYRTRSIGLGRPLPSWVPDWSMDAISECCSPLADDIRDVDLRYHAAKETEPEIRVLLQTKSATSPTELCSSAVLAATGLLLDRIEEVSDSMHTSDTSRSPSSQPIWADWYRIALCNAKSSPYKGADGCRDALWRTLVLDAAGMHSKSRASEGSGKGFHQALINMIIGGVLPDEVKTFIADNGRLYFVDYNTRQVSWAYPRGTAGEDETEPLLPGWEMRMTNDKRVYFVDHNTQTTTWEHPNKPKKGDTSGSEGREKIRAPLFPEEFEVWSKELRKWLDDRGNRHLNRRLFRTERGYLGTSCTHVQAGDTVAILWGGRLPFILRPHGKVKLVSKKIGHEYEPICPDDVPGTDKESIIVETYRLIGGECYVHGLADGQAFDIAKEMELQPTAVYIR